MAQNRVLTIAVPAYNMERWLAKNLHTYRDPALAGRLEVLCLNNASTDATKAIIETAVRDCPEIFTLIDRPGRGYGGSVNQAIAQANGRYFRIVDADDWVNTAELVKLVDALERCTADLVLTDYQMVHLRTGQMLPVRAGDRGGEYGRVFHDFALPTRTLPSMHSMTYRTGLLRACGFQMQDNLFFVDEEFVILPCLAAGSVIYYPFDIYRYQVANPAQSTSPQNRARYQAHREKILKRLIGEYRRAGRAAPSARAYCAERICRGVGDHFTTLYMYVEDRKEGRRLAREWRKYLQAEAGAFWARARKKAAVLKAANLLHLSLPNYERLKGLYLKKKGGTLHEI